MNLNNLKIGVRLAAANAIMLALIIGMALVGLSGMARSNDALHHITKVNLVKISLVETMSESVHIVARVMRTMALIDEPAEAQREFAKITAAREAYDTALGKLEGMPLDAAGRATIGRLKEAQAAARPVNDRFLQMIRSDRPAAIQLLRTDAARALTAWQEELHGYEALQRSKNAQDEAAAELAYDDARLWMFVSLALALAAGVALAWLQSRSIVRPLRAAVDVARTVAAGDLTADIGSTARDETGELLRALAEMNARLRDMVGQVRSGAQSVAVASAQIASGNLDLSTRTEEQAGTLEETAASMEEMNANVQHSMENAQTAQDMAQRAAQDAQHSGELVAQVIATMGAIDAASHKIADITTVIDGIAFQTNILALNAAVEAARAGEQGRGFAVVASEVRSLAQRCATAAREIKVLIADSGAQVKQGSQQVELAGAAIGHTVGRVQQVSAMVSDMAAACREQYTGIGQLNHALTEIDGITQQNAALVEEAASAAASLQQQAAMLEQMVSQFRTGHPGQAGQHRAAGLPALPRREAPRARTMNLHAMAS
ncbi:HAMP domain-containing protein [Duganella sp. FT92W]|uniref:HAMP domain-containing protein n=1 Tax=Pseudoduganella rivuli TaxID=2666085 RepID=A0A7X2IKH8_9BURK|nr:methyl-accepting chemotaxis protein [Pseudoduganella rivuli]MRV71516.1 HAMP domain-containing protein [Pseudoduganella rivuli]